MTQKKTGKILFEGIESGMKLFRWIVLVLVVMFWLSGITSIPDRNVGLLTRFGKIVPKSELARERGAGFVWAFPYPIDELVQVSTGVEQRIEVSEMWADLDLPKGNDNIDPILEGYCLTGDKNIVQAKFVVKYIIKDAEQFHFHMYEPDRIIQESMLASLTETLMTWSMDDAINMSRPLSGRTSASVASAEMVYLDGSQNASGDQVEKLADTVMLKTQDRLDAINCGVQISGIEIVAMNPPRHVKEEFDNVNTVKIANNTRLIQSETEANTLVKKAENTRKQLVASALQWKTRVVADAQTELYRFKSEYDGFVQAPDQVWQRLYAEAMEDVWGNVGRLDFVPAGSRIILPSEQPQEEQQ